MGSTAYTGPQCLYKGALYIYQYTSALGADGNKFLRNAGITKLATQRHIPEDMNPQE